MTHERRYSFLSFNKMHKQWLGSKTEANSIWKRATEKAYAFVEIARICLWINKKNWIDIFEMVQYHAENENIEDSSLL